MAPIIEFLGFFTLIYLALTGGVNWHTALVIFLAIYVFCVSLSLVVLFYDYTLGGSYRKLRSYLWIVGAALLEPFFYHPFIIFFSLRGYWNYLIQTKAIWGEMTRKGFANPKKNKK